MGETLTEFPKLERAVELSLYAWAGFSIRVAVTAILAWAAIVAARRSVAAWEAKAGTRESLETAIRWAPDDASNYAALARLADLERSDDRFSGATRLLRRAVSLEPRRATLWLELALAEDECGNVEEAESDFLHARDLFPRSPRVNFALGAFYLRQWRKEEAFAALRTAVQGDPEIRSDVFHLVISSGLGAQDVLDKMMPPDHDILLAYLNTLASDGLLDDAAVVWKRLRTLGPVRPGETFAYADALIANQRASEVRALWAEVAGDAESLSDASAPNLIFNGGFESRTLQGGLDWRIVSVPRVYVTTDSTVKHDGACSLRIEFDPAENISYEHVFQFVPVEPNTEYEFSAYLQTKDILSDSGPRFELQDAAAPDRLDIVTGDVRGTTAWTQVQARFRTGPETHILTVRIARRASHSFDDRMSGTVWADSVRLVRAED